MSILQRTLAAVLLLSLSNGAFSKPKSQAEPDVEFCNQVGSFAATLSLIREVKVSDNVVSSTARDVAKNTAFNYSQTRSRMLGVRDDPSIQFLTPAEFAAKSFFWCLYDSRQFNYGMDVFHVQSTMEAAYQNMINQSESE